MKENMDKILRTTKPQSWSGDEGIFVPTKANEKLVTDEVITDWSTDLCYLPSNQNNTDTYMVLQW